MRHAQRNCRLDIGLEQLEQRWLLNGTIRGQVVDDTNGQAGIDGVTVYIDADNDLRLDTGEISTVTDAAGEFRIQQYYPRRL